MIIFIIITVVAIILVKRRSANLKYKITRNPENEANTSTFIRECETNSQSIPTDITEEKEPSEKEQDSDNENEKPPSGAEPVHGDSDSIDNHECGLDQREATITQTAYDMGKNIASTTYFAVETSVSFVASLPSKIWGEPTEGQENSS
jgi:hypothetical protein